MPDPIAQRIQAAAEPVTAPETADLDALIERLGSARVVLLGEATHGTSEFYRMRARITRELIERHGFDFVAVEADWPDAQRIDAHVRHLELPRPEWQAFARFPTWMWRNEEVRAFVDWLREHNAEVDDPSARVGVHGLDLYSMYNSMAAVLDYLDDVDPETADLARQRYGCLTPWGQEPADYGLAVVTGRWRSCEPEAVDMLNELLAKRLDYQRHDGLRFLDAAQNARVVADAEHYYRAMYYGRAESWNLRDRHMFATLQSLLAHRDNSKAVVWEHNSHIGNAAATSMGAHGETNVGELARKTFGNAAVLVGFGTDHGEVAAADDWDGPMHVKRVRPALPDSYEALCHAAEPDAFVLPLRADTEAREALRQSLAPPRLERAIGVIYRPETERQSHWLYASLPAQFDEYIWIDRTSAVSPLPAEPEPGLPDTYPFGL
ncbi:erythromycin esterase family protein [Thiohalocapsa halophila]|nr:erythromycin esterase family protein [Thiohalocapsa halophila]